LPISNMRFSISAQEASCSLLRALKRLIRVYNTVMNRSSVGYAMILDVADLWLPVRPNAALTFACKLYPWSLLRSKPG
jgi:hypothetical protein